MHDVPGEDQDTNIAPPEQNTGPDAKDENWQEELIRRSLAGDESAFAFIADKYGNLLLRTAYLLIQDEESARDIVQDALLLAWKNLAQLREPAFLRAWLLKIVVNQATSLKRQFARKASILREQILQNYVDISIQEADIQRGRLEESIDLEQALKRLPPNQSTVIVLFYYHKMTMPEISLMLGASENTLRKRLQAALEKLRRAMFVEVSPPLEATGEKHDIHSNLGVRRGEVQ